MKICVTATANSLDAQIDPRFGRCAYLIIVDSETMQFEAIPNAAPKLTFLKSVEEKNWLKICRFRT